MAAEGESPTSYVDSTSLTESEDGDTDREVTSILNVLKAPKVSVQNRKRKVLSNPGRGKRRCYIVYSFSTVNHA